MAVLTSTRQSPAYLYVKTYCLCALVTLFQATPVSSSLSIATKRPQAYKRGSFTPSSPHNEVSKHRSRVFRHQLDPNRGQIESPSLLASVASVPEYSKRIIERWYHRAVDLAQVKALLRRDDNDFMTYPELGWDATVRHSSSLHPEEKQFVSSRRHRISSQGDDSLRRFLDLPADEVIDPRDVPLVALGGSGGGYRAMYGLTAFISASKKLLLWDCITWTAGVSGSCWTIAAYYTIARHDVSRLLRHYFCVASEFAHPLSVRALDIVARSSKGVYFLIGPLVRKAQTSIIGLGIMDLYATLTTSYQFLSRESKGRLSRATFQFSKVWSRSELGRGLHPMPILTAVRRVPRYSFPTRAKMSVPTPHTPRMLPHQAAAHRQKGLSALEAVETPHQKVVQNKSFHWFEISPLEIGSPDLNRYVPTWSWGRTFQSGYSVDRRPEQSLSLLLGQCTSAPAGPLTGYVSALLATMPKGTIMSRALSVFNSFLGMKCWERLWCNPIRAGHDPNPFYGFETPVKQHCEVIQSRREFGPLTFKRSISKNRSSLFSGVRTDDTKEFVSWEAQGRVRLMDSGMSNNLPNHILARPERSADVIIAFDASSDVRSGAAIQRLHTFAQECHIDLKEETETFKPLKPQFYPDGSNERSKAAKVEAQFLHLYSRVFCGVRENGQELYIIYCPLLPNGANPDFDPSRASFSTSYNLVWSPEQIRTLVETTEANLTLYAIDTIKQVIKKVYLEKRARRLVSGPKCLQDVTKPGTTAI